MLSKMESLNDGEEFQRSYKRRMNTCMLNIFILHVRELCREVSQGTGRHENVRDGPVTKV